MKIKDDPKFHEHLRDWSNATNDDDERAALDILCQYVDSIKPTHISHCEVGVQYITLVHPAPTKKG